MFENVVVGIRDDGAAARDAIALSKELVSPKGKLTLLHVLVVTSKPAPDPGSVWYAARSRYALERLMALVAELELDAQVACVEARSARRGLHQVASDRHADLLVVGASGRDELAREFIGDDTREVLRDAPCTVAVAPAGYSARATAIRMIGVAYDESPESDRALALARRLAAERHAELSAFEAVGAPMSVRDPLNVTGDFEEPVEAARQRVAALGGLEAQARSGDAVEELASYGLSVDLLVLGSHKHRPIDRLLEPTIAQHLADQASPPLLVLPPAARAG